MDALTALSRMPSGINAYTDAGHRRKRVMHSAGRAFLQRLARDLGLQTHQRDIRSNVAGIAVSGEVTLHADRLYVQISESCIGRGGPMVLYRTCRGRNHTRSLGEIGRPGGYDRFLAECRELLQ